MPFPIPGAWSHDTVDVDREERKRSASPPSFFFSQGQALVLAANYFQHERLADGSREGVALKHRHRIHLALFGQLLAAFEYMLKDFVAKAIDQTDVFDEQLKREKWLNVDISRVLSHRSAPMTTGALLVHPTLGWHESENVNLRYKSLFEFEPVPAAGLATLDRLWIIRHTVAHNAGYVTAHDSVRVGAPNLANKALDIDESFIESTFDFLGGISRSIANNVGDRVVLKFMKARKELGLDFQRDQGPYTALKHLATYVENRATELPAVTSAMYATDGGRV